MDFGVLVFNNFSVSLYASLTPLLYGICIDEHFARTLVFKDYFRFGFYIKGGGELSYTLNNRIAIALSGSYMRLGNTKGDEEVYNRGMQIYFSPGTVGGGFSFWDLALSLRYTFK